MYSDAFIRIAQTEQPKLYFLKYIFLDQKAVKGDTEGSIVNDKVVVASKRD